VVLLTGNTGDGDDVEPTRLVLLRSAIARKLDTTSVPLAGLEHDEDDEVDDDEEHDEHDEHDPDSDHGAEETGKAEGDTGA